jgi:transposase
MKAKRRTHDSAFKARVALEALKGIKTIQQIAKDFEIHPGQVCDWKKTLQERLSNAFEGGPPSGATDDFEEERAALHSKIGELTVKLDFVTKKSKQLGL